MPSTTAPSLLAAARDGHSDAWQQIVHLYGPLIYGWCRRVGRQSADAADATQDVLMSVSRDLHRFDPEIAGATFRGWLWTITRRRLADQARQHARRIEQAEGSLGSVVAAGAVEAEEPPTDAAADRAAVISRAAAILRDQFEPNSWQAFWATVAEGRQPAEVAESLGMSRWAVYKARARVLQRLREELEGLI
jgi:RNA polymerase sigma-70 factor (ECF subfamily)